MRHRCSTNTSRLMCDACATCQHINSHVQSEHTHDDSVNYDGHSVNFDEQPQLVNFDGAINRSQEKESTDEPGCTSKEAK